MSPMAQKDMHRMATVNSLDMLQIVNNYNGSLSKKIKF
jgi:hypothetical protein